MKMKSGTVRADGGGGGGEGVHRINACMFYVIQKTCRVFSYIMHALARVLVKRMSM